MKIDLPTIDIYLNNLCNKTCESCLVYSNFVFTGNYSWTVSEPFLNQWNNVANITQINLLGGEPLLHPNLLEWITGVKRIFGDQISYRLYIGASVSMLEKNLDLLHEIIKTGFILDINIHDYNELNDTVDFIDNILFKGEKINKVVASTEEHMYIKDITKFPIEYWIDNTNPLRITPAWSFLTGNVKTITDNKLYFYNSDPKKAFDKCPFKPNIAFLDGRLYKCPSLVTLQNFSKQVLCDQQELIDSIDSVSPFDSFEKIQEYIESLKYHVKQCTLCPEERTVVLLKNDIKKIKLVRKLQ